MWRPIADENTDDAEIVMQHWWEEVYDLTVGSSYRCSKCHSYIPTNAWIFCLNPACEIPILMELQFGINVWEHCDEWMDSHEIDVLEYRDVKGETWRAVPKHRVRN